MIDPVVQDRKRQEAKEIAAEKLSVAAWKNAENHFYYSMTLSELREQLDNLEYDGKEPVGWKYIGEEVLNNLAEEQLEHD